MPGLSLAFAGPFFKEFAIRSKKDPKRVLAEVRTLGLSRRNRSRKIRSPGCFDLILIACTEKRTKAEIDGLAAAYRNAMNREHSKPSLTVALRRDRYPSEPINHVQTRPSFAALRNQSSWAIHGDFAGVGRAGTLARRVGSGTRIAQNRSLPLPELGELDVVRHYTNLSTSNMNIDANFYPLGSCTMKYNPKRNERLAALPGMAAPASVIKRRPRSRDCSKSSTKCEELSRRKSAGWTPSACSRRPGRTESSRPCSSRRPTSETRKRNGRKSSFPIAPHGTNPASAKSGRIRSGRDQEQ